MADLWRLVRERGVESFFTRALYGNDLVERGMVKPKGGVEKSDMTR